ncbi:MAG TPA: hypothetical protein DGU45_09900 [Planctomycetes bacterium]|nr:hypothetical protein [Planctomycetota bacterium]
MIDEGRILDRIDGLNHTITQLISRIRQCFRGHCGDLASSFKEGLTNHFDLLRWGAVWALGRHLYLCSIDLLSLNLPGYKSQNLYQAQWLTLNHLRQGS